MRTIIILSILLVMLFACDSGSEWKDKKSICEAGAMRCNENVVQMCDEEHYDDWKWIDQENCNYSASGHSCSTSYVDCDGFTGIACCH